MKRELSAMFALAFVAFVCVTGARAAHKDDATFVKDAAIGGMFEVQAGKLASEKGLDAEVKSFGAMMVKDHGAAGDELKALAAKKGWSFPTELDKDHQKKLDHLAGLSGADFDKAYLADMRKGHKACFDEFKHVSESPKMDADLRAWVSKTLGVVEAHLKHIEGIKVASK